MNTLKISSLYFQIPLLVIVLWLGINTAKANKTTLFKSHPVNGTEIDESLELSFSAKRGFYDNPFNLELTSNKVGTVIRYTTNGELPTPTSGNIYSSPIPINSTAYIRAIAYTNSEVTKVYTHTYIFTKDVINQPNSVAGFPTTNFAFDASIKNNATYNNQLEEALRQIGTISIVIDLKDLEQVHNGNSEMPTSMELIYPDGQENHQQDCGLERFGGTSYENPKRNFRLSFKSIYGEGKLNYPLFGEGVSEEFDQIALRAGHAGCINRYGTYLNTGESNDIADQVVRDLQINMQEDGIGVAGNFMHLYINGIYWGVYNTTERPTAGWAGKYYGGSKEDWDIIKTKAALVGNANTWNTLNNLVDNQNMAVAANYNAIQNYIDIRQFIDCLLYTSPSPRDLSTSRMPSSA